MTSLPLKKQTKILLEGIQVKSIEKARKLAHALNIIEEECGIHEVEITLKNIFWCPWIDMEELNATHMERFIRDLVNKIQR